MDTPRYKVAYMETNSPFRLFSDFFDTQSKAHQEGVHYEWDLIKDSSTWKYRVGIFLTSSKFVVPLVLIVLTYLLLRRNNGLPRVIG